MVAGWEAWVENDKVSSDTHRNAGVASFLLAFREQGLVMA